MKGWARRLKAALPIKFPTASPAPIDAGAPWCGWAGTSQAALCCIGIALQAMESPSSLQVGGGPGPRFSLLLAEAFPAAVRACLLLWAAPLLPLRACWDNWTPNPGHADIWVASMRAPAAVQETPSCRAWTANG